MLSPTELAELRAKAPALIAEAKRTVTATEVRSILTPLVLVFGIGAAAETSTFWSTYSTVLAPLHPAALKAGCEAYLALPDARFFPKPGELLGLARKAHLGPLFAAACHASAALRYEPPKRIERADAAVVGRVHTDLARALRRSPPPKPFTPPPTLTDEHGLSPAMAALMNQEAA